MGTGVVGPPSCVSTRMTQTPSRVHATASLLVLLLAAFLTTTPLTTASLTTTSFYLGQGLKHYIVLTDLLLALPHLIQSEFTHAPGMSSGRSPIG